MSRMNEKIISVIEDLGWIVRESESDYEIETCSPAGEDLIETIYKDEDIVEQFWEIYYDFDEEEHVEMWVKARGHVGGIPSIITLVRDAGEIRKMYEELALAVEKAARQEEEE